VLIYFGITLMAAVQFDQSRQTAVAWCFWSRAGLPVKGKLKKYFYCHSSLTLLSAV